MACPSCGEPIRPGSRLCTSCGAWLLDDDLRTDKSVPSFSPTAGPRIVPPGPMPTGPMPTGPMSTGPMPTGSMPADPSGWAPPRAAQRVDQPPPGGFGGFAAAPASAPFSAPFVVPVDDEFEEHTTLSSRRSGKAAFWTLSLPNGAVELVTDRAIVIGREPQFMPALPQARLIPVPDPTRSVSKNHACFSMYGAALVVEDLGSTNGIVVTRPDGRESDLGVGGRTELEAGSKVELGDAVITIGRA